MADRPRSRDRPPSPPEESTARHRRSQIAVVVGVLLVGIGVLVGLLVSAPGSGPAKASTTSIPAAPGGPERIPLEAGPPLAPASTAATGQTVDGIECNSTEQAVYHVHTHLSVFVDGTARPVPAGIGIVLPLVQSTPNGAFLVASHCYYWLHVHAQDGVIHIESPTEQRYTLGQFFDLWQQPLSSTQVGPASGTVTAFVNGRRFAGDPRAIPLGSREVIQLDVGTPVAPVRVDWSPTSL